MLLIYRVVSFFLLPIAMLRLLFKAKQDYRYLYQCQERLGWYKKTSANLIWLHAVSVGEVMAAKPLVDGLLQQHPKHNILITVMTPTGRARAHELYNKNNNVNCVYLVYDIKLFANIFLNFFKPVIALVMETEIWPNIFIATKQRKIPLIMVNARLSEKSYQQYQHVATLIKTALRQITLIAAQTTEDQQRFQMLGMPKEKTAVFGSIKYDLVTQHSSYIKRYQHILLAVSTHPGEEEQVIKAFIQLKNRFTDAKLVVAPRHQHRAGEITTMLKRYKLNNSALYSDIGNNIENIDILIVDRIGVLESFYVMANVAFVGGSLIDRGGQNPIEPAAAATPVLMGPSRYNFLKVCKSLTQDNVLFLVNNHNDITEKVTAIFIDKDYASQVGQRALKNIKSHQGATRKYLKFIATII